MRTTLDIDEDVLNATKELARREHLPAGQIVSRLLRGVLTGQLRPVPAPDAAKATVSGFRPFGARGTIVSNDQVNALRDQEGI